MDTTASHGLTLYTESDEQAETEPEVEECTLRMDVPRPALPDRVWWD
jgi:hypothetical protein